MNSLFPVFVVTTIMMVMVPFNLLGGTVVLGHEIPPVTTWPNRPLFLYKDSAVHSNDDDVPKLKGDKRTTIGDITYHLPCPIGTQFNFTSNLFEGKALIEINGINNKIEDSVAAARRIYKSKLIIQGRFKKAVQVKDVVVGREFDKPLKRKVPEHINRFLSNIIPGVIELDLTSKTRPKVLSSLIKSFELVRADRGGFEPSIFELGRSFNNIFGSDYTPSIGSSKKLVEGDVFDTDHVYSFVHTDNLIDYLEYSIDLKLLRIDLAMVNGQPLQFMAKDTNTQKYLWMFHIHHEKLF